MKTVVLYDNTMKQLTFMSPQIKHSVLGLYERFIVQSNKATSLSKFPEIDLSVHTIIQWEDLVLTCAAHNSVIFSSRFSEISRGI